ncbi:MAG: hypothetical protein MUO77_13795 [Anaerolineales bacterium]|nr:hypothetical protein [Anaerolineales bacterium]
MIDIARILDAPLPELDMSKPSARSNQGARVQRQLNRYLSTLKKQRGLSDLLVKFRQHLIGITIRWGDDLFVCYDIVGVPSTNNALESRFGRLRRDQRRISGRQFNTATLLDEGPYLIWECGDNEAQVLTRLRRVASNRADYQRRYKTLRTEQERQRLIYRLQHHQAQVFHELEVQWAAIHSDKTV